VGVNEIGPGEIAVHGGDHGGEEAGKLELGAGEVPHVVGDAAAVGETLARRVDRILESLDLDAVHDLALGRAGVMWRDDADGGVALADQRLR
jgi:hypothetical protein